MVHLGARQGDARKMGIRGMVRWVPFNGAVNDERGLSSILQKGTAASLPISDSAAGGRRES